MKPSTYQKLFLNRSTKTIVILATIALWLVVTVAFSTAVFSLESQRISDQKTLRRKSIEETLIRVFEGYAKFGDIINSKGTVIEIGKPFGLSSFEICRNGLSVPPKPFNDVCTDLKGGYVLNLNQETYELFFRWDEKSDTELARVFELLILTGLISLVLVTLVIIAFLRIFKTRLGYIANQISNVDSIEGIEHFKLDVPELKPITSSIRNLFEVVNEYSIEISRLKLEEFKTEVARQVAHDIRSPLSALQIAVSKLPNEGTEYNLIVSASQRIRAIADDLLKKSGKTEANIVQQAMTLQESVDLKQIIYAIVEEKSISFKGKIEIDLQDETSMEALGSKTELERILSNLLNNAIESYTDASEAQITIFLRGYGEYINLTVADNGVGIPEDILKKLGQKGATFGKQSGSGLGLYSAKQYLERLGGKLDIQSRIGHGTMVTVALPHKK